MPENAKRSHVTECEGIKTYQATQNSSLLRLEVRNKLLNFNMRSFGYSSEMS